MLMIMFVRQATSMRHTYTASLYEQEVANFSVHKQCKISIYNMYKMRSQILIP